MCKTCGDVQLGVFFFFAEAQWLQIQGLPALPECYGCRLTYYLRRETDHYKAKKRSIIKTWLKDDDGWNTTDLRKATEDYDLFAIEHLASELDYLRRKESMEGEDPYDRETNERQRPYTYDETKGFRGAFLRSPEVCYEKNMEKAYFGPKDAYQWAYEDRNRYDHHGLHY